MKGLDLKKNYLFIGAFVIILLFILGWILKIRINLLKKDNLKNQAVLNQALPGFNNKSVEELKKEVDSLKLEAVKLAGIFDPKEKWLKEGYDLSIHFVEELGQINQFLKTKAVKNQVTAPEIGFKEKLPSDQDGFYLLSQLYGLREVISLGMDEGINFKSIKPKDLEDAKELPGIKLAKSEIELTSPAAGLIEFIIRINEALPRPNIDGLTLKSQDSGFSVALKLTHIVTDLDWKDKPKLTEPVNLAEFQSETDFESKRILRSKNIFLIQMEKEMSLSKTQEQGESAKGDSLKKISRFSYRGKALFKSKEVVVIEDALNKETHFLAEGGRIDNFILKKFSNEEVVLRNINDGKELIVRREE